MPSIGEPTKDPHSRLAAVIDSTSDAIRTAMELIDRDPADLKLLANGLNRVADGFDNVSKAAVATEELRRSATLSPHPDDLTTSNVLRVLSGRLLNSCGDENLLGEVRQCLQAGKHYVEKWSSPPSLEGWDIELRTGKLKDG